MQSFAFQNRPYETDKNASESSVLEQSVCELLRRLRTRELSSESLVERHIERINRVNPHINALIAERFEQARAEAKEADKRYDSMEEGARETLPPLLGIPCSIKEFVAQKGMPLTGGLLRRRDRIAQEDSTVVARLRAAGAIPLGASNVPEGGLWMETHNLIWGRTRNPWNVGRTSGGSSGGEGALLGSGAVPFGMGSDIGGSIRIPAAFCGVVGHKPSAGLVPNTGHFPASHDPHGYMVIGPLCRKVEDVMPILRVIAGPDGQDSTCVPLPLSDPQTVRLGDVRVFSWHGKGEVSAVMQDAILRSADALCSVGAQSGRLSLPNFDRGFLLWAAAMQAENPEGYKPVIQTEGKFDLMKELLRFPLGRSEFVLPTLMTLLLDSLSRRLPLKPDKLLSQLAKLRAELDAQLGNNGVILHPPYSRPAPRHRMALLTPLHAACTALYNVLGYAVTVVPVGLDDEGLPVAVQVVARRGNDHLALACAQVLEAKLGGFRYATP
ncbi:MAG TPA: amidase [Pseudomonadota bacterium]|nr:amidase [Pseudomonadota bacterium]